MKLSDITNKYPNGREFQYPGTDIYLKLKFTADIESARQVFLKDVLKDDYQKAVAENDAETVERLENRATMMAFSTVGFIGFRGIEDDDGNQLPDTFENRVIICEQVDLLFSFMSEKTSDYGLWVEPPEEQDSEGGQSQPSASSE